MISPGRMKPPSSESWSAVSDIASLGTILGIWAHPDDESFMVGGLLSMAATNGQQVICFTATKGEAGQTADETRWPQAKLNEIRAAELEKALDILGIQQHHLFDYGDGKCDQVPDDMVLPVISGLIEKYQPDTIITFPPDGVTGHPDHQTVSRWARAAAAVASKKPQVYFAVQTQEAYDSYLKVMDEKFNVYFATDDPVFVPEAECDLLFKLDTVTVARKAAALKAQASQFNAMFTFLGDEGVSAALGVEGLVKAENDARWAHL